MAKVTILNEGVTFEVPDGSRLLEYAKKHSNMLFGCEQGKCGVCRCNIAKGFENLNQKTSEEEHTLTRLGAYPSQRLACKIIVKKGEVEIEY
ncbi:(2Fe-2S)-binding protein [Candidatus Micrarchaeota archaeon]|nr:(2Fe-2S)-binding protein [Candidatus Micrarchaeota archaeon]MBU1166269.1 (2Fe-2S)-binding protein [Candidatus Micrarchaeota archaeon]MBU1886738.1 (2Fe-2S)-binding protein [Candidatus Micrarchaeota archaeon]